MSKRDLMTIWWSELTYGQRWRVHQIVIKYWKEYPDCMDVKPDGIPDEIPSREDEERAKK